jgi:hypothetical protein
MRRVLAPKPCDEEGTPDRARIASRRSEDGGIAVAESWLGQHVLRDIGAGEHSRHAEDGEAIACTRDAVSQYAANAREVHVGAWPS